MNSASVRFEEEQDNELMDLPNIDFDDGKYLIIQYGYKKSIYAIM